MTGIIDPKPLLELAFSSLFARFYSYAMPDEREIVSALLAAGIHNPIDALTEWRKEKGLLTDRELAEKGKE
jgi:hypothetical protein